MAATKRTAYQINKDRKLILKLLEEGLLSHAEIAEKINKRYQLDGLEIQLSRQQISYDITEILGEMEEDIVSDCKKLIPLQTRRYLTLYNELWKAWKKSLTDQEKRSLKERDGEFSFVEQTTETVLGKGDPRYVTAAANILSKIDRLNGLYIKDAITEEDEEDEDEEETFETDIPDNGRD